MYILMFCFNDPAPPQIYTYGHTLPLHDALPIAARARHAVGALQVAGVGELPGQADGRVQAQLELVDQRAAGGPGWAFRSESHAASSVRGRIMSLDRKSTRLNSSH